MGPTTLKRIGDLNALPRSMPAGRRVVVVTGGHLSTCPRMLKAADALHETGFDVRVVSTRFVPWATATDVDVMSTRSWQWQVVDYSKPSGGLLRISSALRTRAARLWVERVAGAGRTPLGVAAAAYSRVHHELVAAVAQSPADFIYGGTGSALAATFAAARRAGIPYALDLEDFHTGEHGVDDPFRDSLAEAIEERVLAGARFLTTSSDAMAAAYQSKYGVTSSVIHNVVPLPSAPPDLNRSADQPLRLYWFSQTIGPRRGIQDIINAAGLAKVPFELHLRGRPADGYLEHLHKLQSAVAPSLKIVHHPPAPPDAMVDVAREFDIGLATELPSPMNHAICLSNKLFTYVAAGLAIVCSDTPAQREFAGSLGLGAALYRPGDVATLSDHLLRWHSNRPALVIARRVAWAAAQRRWRWDHRDERDALVNLVERATATAVESADAHRHHR